MRLALTPLERACLEIIASEHWPSLLVDGLRVRKREDVGFGRYVHLEDHRRNVLRDGTYESRHRAIEMEGVPFGLEFAAVVISSRLHHLELITPSASGWDGVERRWKVTGTQPTRR
jgi:hypothetical protein